MFFKNFYKNIKTFYIYEWLEIDQQPEYEIRIQH